MKNVQKIYFNGLLLVFLFSMLLLPALSGGMMKVNKNDRVLSITSERPEQTTEMKKQIPVKPAKKIETIIIKEIPASVVQLDSYPETTQTTETR